MEDLSLHILDITENSIRAGANKIKILILEDIKANLLLLEICDNGKGMDKEMVKRVCDPFIQQNQSDESDLVSRFLLRPPENAGEI